MILLLLFVSGAASSGLATRRSVLLSGAAASLPRPPAFAATPTASEEVARVLLEPWEEEPPFGRGGFRRLDESDDAEFYTQPRLVNHIDDAAVAAATKFYTALFMELASERAAAPEVLDLCSSWVSHYPPDSAVRLGRVAGLGMNAEELQANPRLTEWVVRDLNKAPVRLPHADGSFDAVTCTVSIDYLTRPLEVMAECARVLRPGGRLAILISDRLFFSKAVALWTGKDDLEHCYTVGAYIHYGAGAAMADPRAIDLSRRSRNGKPIGDPLFAIVATRL